MEFEHIYEKIDRAFMSGDEIELREIRDRLYKEEGYLTVQRITASVKEKCNLNLNISEIHSHIFNVNSKLNQLRER